MMWWKIEDSRKITKYKKRKKHGLIEEADDEKNSELNDSRLINLEGL